MNRTVSAGPLMCKHCGRLTVNGLHTEGGQRGLMRCDPADSRLPYGYNAEAANQPCTIACLGSVKP